MRSKKLVESSSGKGIHKDLTDLGPLLQQVAKSAGLSIVSRMTSLMTYSFYFFHISILNRPNQYWENI